jgi:hypothetical protein
MGGGEEDRKNIKKERIEHERNGQLLDGGREVQRRKRECGERMSR